MTLRNALLFIIFASSTALADNDQANYSQVYVGFNGPSDASLSQYSSADSVKSSWLVSSLTAKELEQVLSKIDFKKEMLLADAVGERETSTGSVIVSQVMETDDALITFLRIGVNETTCKEPQYPSKPFVLLVVKKQNTTFKSTGFDHQNFGDGCKPVATEKNNKIMF